MSGDRDVLFLLKKKCVIFRWERILLEILFCIDV